MGSRGEIVDLFAHQGFHGVQFERSTRGAGAHARAIVNDHCHLIPPTVIQWVGGALQRRGLNRANRCAGGDEAKGFVDAHILYHSGRGGGVGGHGEIFPGFQKAAHVTLRVVTEIRRGKDLLDACLAVADRILVIVGAVQKVPEQTGNCAFVALTGGAAGCFKIDNRAVDVDVKAGKTGPRLNGAHGALIVIGEAFAPRELQPRGPIV